MSLSFVTGFGKTDKSAVLAGTELPRPCVMGKASRWGVGRVHTHPLSPYGVQTLLGCSLNKHISVADRQTEALFHSHNTEKCSGKLNWSRYNKNLQQFPLLRTSENTKCQGVTGGTICTVDLAPFGSSLRPLTLILPRSRRERYGSTLLPATREQHDQNCTQSH